MKINRIIWVALFSVLLAVSLTSCGGGGGDSGGGGGESGTEEKAIKQLYTTWESSMEGEDITAFGSCLSSDYSHQQLTKDDWITMMEDTFENASNIQVFITNLNITVTGNSATASFHFKVTTAEEGVVQDEDTSPNPQGFFNYLIKEDGAWKFYGDQTPST